MKKICLWMLSLTLFFNAASAHAVPIVSIDSDLVTPGIQSSFGINIGSPLTIGVVISGVEVGSPLNAFEFDLDFDSTLLSATSVADGGFLLAPKFTLESDLIAPDVNFLEITLLPIGAFGSGVLATITFDTIGLGISPLDLNDVILSAPFAIPITVASVADGQVTVVPEPASLLLMGLGLIGLAISARRKRRVQK